MDAAHRRAAMVEGGQLWLAQRYAIDWVQGAPGERHDVPPFNGPKALATRAISATASRSTALPTGNGRRMRVDGLADNVPHSGNYAESDRFQQRGGQPRRRRDRVGDATCSYAHMKPGYGAGEGRLRASGSGDVSRRMSATLAARPSRTCTCTSTITPSFLGGNSVPYAIRLSAWRAARPRRTSPLPEPSLSAPSGRRGRSPTTIRTTRRWCRSKDTRSVPALLPRPQPGTAVQVAADFGTDIASPGAEPTISHPWRAARIGSALASVG